MSDMSEEEWEEASRQTNETKHKVSVQLMGKWSYLNPLGAPISALVSFGPFFFPVLSFLPVRSEAGAGIGTGVERYLDATISGFWMSTVTITVGCETGPGYWS